jgi:hypothetical protein
MAFKPLAIKNIERTKPVDSNGITRMQNIIDNVLNCIKGIWHTLFNKFQKSA